MAYKPNRRTGPARPITGAEWLRGAVMNASFFFKLACGTTGLRGFVPFDVAIAHNKAVSSF
jgi:hypothetical protein